MICLCGPIGQKIGLRIIGFYLMVSGWTTNIRPWVQGLACIPLYYTYHVFLNFTERPMWLWNLGVP